jgi:hypothetical protein
MGTYNRVSKKAEVYVEFKNINKAKSAAFKYDFGVFF